MAVVFALELSALVVPLERELGVERRYGGSLSVHLSGFWFILGAAGFEFGQP
jgi:hypothetical protein